VKVENVDISETNTQGNGNKQI